MYSDEESPYLKFFLVLINHPAQVLVLLLVSLVDRDLCGYVALGAELSDFILDLCHHIHILCSTDPKHLQGTGNLTVNNYTGHMYSYIQGYMYFAKQNI